MPKSKLDAAKPEVRACRKSKCPFPAVDKSPLCKKHLTARRVQRRRDHSRQKLAKMGVVMPYKAKSTCALCGRPGHRCETCPKNPKSKERKAA